MTTQNLIGPYHTFRFVVTFKEDAFAGGSATDVPLCRGAFAECTGLEATMEPKVIKEGGRNYGTAQRAGPVTFATVILKRGMTFNHDLWKWFELLTSDGGYAYRLAATITMQDIAGNPVLEWKLEKAMPTKFKAADLNAKNSDLAVEELHIVHEGLTLKAIETAPRTLKRAGGGNA